MENHVLFLEVIQVEQAIKSPSILIGFDQIIYLMVYNDFKVNFAM